MLRKGPHICRIGLLNPTGFTVWGGSAKDDQIREFIEKSEFDIVNFLEVNVCWHKVIPRNQLEERTLGWFETLHRFVAYNYADTKVQQQQHGGVAIFSVDDAATQVMGSGCDDTGLG